jgi:hypothetical protein
MTPRFLNSDGTPPRPTAWATQGAAVQNEPADFVTPETVHPIPRSVSGLLLDLKLTLADCLAAGAPKGVRGKGDQAAQAAGDLRAPRVPRCREGRRATRAADGAYPFNSDCCLADGRDYECRHAGSGDGRT